MVLLKHVCILGITISGPLGNMFFSRVLRQFQGENILFDLEPLALADSWP